MVKNAPILDIAISAKSYNSPYSFSLRQISIRIQMEEDIPELISAGADMLDVEPIEVNVKGARKSEEILWKGHPHIVSQLLSIFFGILLFIIGTFSILYTGIVLRQTTLMMLSAIVMFSGLITLLVSYIRLKYTRYVLTDSAVYVQRGWLTDRVTRVPVDTIQSIEYSQKIAERVLGFGTIEVSTAGSDGVELAFESVSNPSSVHTDINEQIESRVVRGRTTTVESSRSDVDKQNSALENELREIRAELQRALEQQDKK